MIILKDKPGQLCNRLWAFTPFISDVLESNTKIIILCFYDYYEYFEDLKIYKNIRFVENKEKSIFYNRLIRILNKIPNRILFHLGVIHNTKNYGTKIKLKNRLDFIDGWSHKKPKKQLEITKIQKLFRPKNIYANKVDEIFLSRRRLSDLIIGVHIRRGDYKEFMNGRYFFLDSTIINFLSQLIKEFGETKNITFLLCSNEKINLEVYKDISIFQIHDSNLIEDLYGLSKCDYIIGPPSTYSMWASFYGQKPLRFLKDSNSILKIKDFSIVVSQNQFESGHVFSH
jgi:hypothetical protein